jgi:hypothetical protein
MTIISVLSLVARARLSVLLTIRAGSSVLLSVILSVGLAVALSAG